MKNPDTVRCALKQFYSTKQELFLWVKQQPDGTEMAGPILMSPSDLYFSQPNPLLIIGQETNGWSYRAEDIEAQLLAYKAFNVGAAYRSSPFWNVTRKVEKALGGAAYSCAWTNISKFDYRGKRATGERAQAISKLDDMLVEEIRLLGPSTCLFFTGPAFDERLKKVFPGVNYLTVPGWKSRQLCQLSHPLLPQRTFRTYHPNYLRQSGLEKKFIDSMTSLFAR